MNNISKERLVTHLVTDFNFTLCKSFNTSDIERTAFGFSAVVDSAYKGKYKFKSTSSGTEPLVKKHNWCRILKNWTQKLSVHSFISKSFWIDVLPSTPVRREVNDHWFDGFHVEHRMHRHLRRTICALIEPKKWNHVLFSKQWLKQPRGRFYPGLILSRDFQTNVSTTINATRCTDAKCVDHKFLMKSDGKQATINQERLETQPTASTHWAVAWSGNECRNEGFHRFSGKKMHHTTSSQLAFWRCINNPLTINLCATRIGQSSVSCGTWCGTWDPMWDPTWDPMWDMNKCNNTTNEFSHPGLLPLSNQLKRVVGFRFFWWHHWRQRRGGGRYWPPQWGGGWTGFNWWGSEAGGHWKKNLPVKESPPTHVA